MAHEIACPFCGFRKDDEYAIQLHIEEHHTEDSPFSIMNSAPDLPPRRDARRTDPSERRDGEWMKCTRPGCGEYLLVSDVQEHLDFHEAVDASEDDVEGARMSGRQAGEGRSRSARKTISDESSSDDSTSKSNSRSTGSSSQCNQWEGGSRGSSTPRSTTSRTTGTSSSRSLLDYFSGTSNHGRPPLPPRPPRRIEEPRHPGRLGKAELGPHAFEDKMPAEVRRRLINDALPRQANRIGRDGRIIKDSIIDNETEGLICVLADFCGRARSTEVAYFSHPSTRHIHKIRCDGNFCGYWNIQMMSSFLAHNAGNTSLLPNVLAIQDTIEQAWDNGICSYSRIETGGIRNTRKWIGTHDALAYFTQIGIAMQASSFKDEDEDQPAVLGLLDHLEAYFMSGLESAERRGSSYITELPPVYFQRAGHSMTIVGLERKRDGHRNLVIFDPSFGTTRSMDLVLEGRRTNAEARTLLKPYRRSDESLSRWKEFEILM